MVDTVTSTAFTFRRTTSNYRVKRFEKTQISYVYFPKTLKISTISTTITSVRTCQRSNLEVYVKRLGKILTGLSLSISLVKRTTGSTGKISTSFISYKKYRVHTKMEELLAKICKNTEPKGSRQIVVSSNKTRLIRRCSLTKIKRMKWRLSISRLTTRFRILMRRTIISDTHLTEELHGLTFLYRKEVTTSLTSMTQSNKK